MNSAFDPNALVQELLVAFPPDPPPAAGEYTDLSTRCQEGYMLFPLIAGKRWTDLDLDDAWAQDLVFLLPHAFAYYLPFVLRIALEDPQRWRESDLAHWVVSWLECHPTQERELAYFRERVEAFTPLQRRTIVRVFTWANEVHDATYEKTGHLFMAVSPEILAEFWEPPTDPAD